MNYQPGLIVCTIFETFANNNSNHMRHLQLTSKTAIHKNISANCAIAIA